MLCAHTVHTYVYYLMFHLGPCEMKEGWLGEVCRFLKLEVVYSLSLTLRNLES